MSILGIFRSKASSTAAAAVLSSVLVGCATVPSDHKPIPYVGKDEPKSCTNYRREIAKTDNNFQRGTNVLIGGLIGSAVGQNNAENRIATGIGAIAGAGVSNAQQQERTDRLYYQCLSDIETLKTGFCAQSVQQTSRGTIINGQRQGDSRGTANERENCTRVGGTPFPTGGNMARDLGGASGQPYQAVPHYQGTPSNAPAANPTQICEQITLQTGASGLLCTNPQTGEKRVFGL